MNGFDTHAHYDSGAFNGDRLDYRYRPELSREGELVFVAP